MQLKISFNYQLTAKGSNVSFKVCDTEIRITWQYRMPYHHMKNPRGVINDCYHSCGVTCQNETSLGKLRCQFNFSFHAIQN